MKFLTSTLGRILFSIPFIVFGINHFINGSQMAAYVPLPGGVFWIYFTGLANVLAGISIITKIQAKNAMLLLTFMLLVFIVTMHIPGLFNPQMQQMSLISLLKDTGLMGGALLFAGIFSEEKQNVKPVF